MLTFITIALTYFLFAWIITKYSNHREWRKGMDRFQILNPSYPYPVLMPVCRRPHYLKQVLAALSNVKNIDKTLLIISQDGSDPRVDRMIHEIKFAKTIIMRHSRPFLGIFSLFWDNMYAVSANIYFLLSFAFSKPNVKGAIVLEDDILPSVDFLNYFNWAFQHILTDESVLSVTGFNINSRLCPIQAYHPKNHPYDMIRNRERGRDKFTGWGWGITKAKWLQIKNDWSFMNWDIGLDKTQRKLGLKSFKPVLGRVKNIGMQGINFTESDENPKWKDVYIAQSCMDYDVNPILLETEAKIPPFEDRKPVEAYRNEKAQTRKNRLLLYGMITALSLIELVCLFF